MMNKPKRPISAAKATRSKEARAAKMSQEKYESTKLNEAFRELSRKQQQERRTNVRTKENIERKKAGSTPTQSTSQKSTEPTPKRQLTSNTQNVTKPQRQLMMRTTKIK
jgi:hypothetical protein